MPKATPTAFHRAAHLAQRIREGGKITLLFETILDSAIEITGAERAYVVTAGSDGSLTVAASRFKGSRPVPPGEAKTSRSIVRAAFERRGPILLPSGLADPRFAEAASVRRLGINALVVVPLFAADDAPLGAVVVEHRKECGFFGDDDVAELKAVAANVGLVIDRREPRQLLADELERTEPDRRHERPLVGSSPALAKLRETIRRVGKKDTTVLILGESGTGKELVAHAIHEESPRREGPFVAFNSAAIPEGLQQAQLFGHVAGAFTGATGASKGILAAANGGTVFLDEVGDMPLTLQAMLLRALQEREFLPVGGITPVKIDVRVLAATHRDLRARIAEGNFREDLYFRLNVVPIEVPPLRTRTEDIPELVSHFLARYQGLRRRPRHVGKEALDHLMMHHWPGNVRELDNAIQRALACSGEDEVIGPQHLALEASSPGGLAPAPTLANAEKQAVVLALKATGDNIMAAARMLDVSNDKLRRDIKRFKIEVRPASERRRS